MADASAQQPPRGQDETAVEPVLPAPGPAAVPAWWAHEAEPADETIVPRPPAAAAPAPGFADAAQEWPSGADATIVPPSAATASWAQEWAGDPDETIVRPPAAVAPPASAGSFGWPQEWADDDPDATIVGSASMPPLSVPPPSVPPAPETAATSDEADGGSDETIMPSPLLGSAGWKTAEAGASDASDASDAQLGHEADPAASPEAPAGGLVPDHWWGTPSPPADADWPPVATPTPIPTPTHTPGLAPPPVPPGAAPAPDATGGWAAPWQSPTAGPGYPAAGYREVASEPEPEPAPARFGGRARVLLVLAVCVVLGAAATGITFLVTRDRDDRGPTIAQALTVAPPTLVARIPAETDPGRTVFALALSADGRRLAVADGARAIGYTGPGLLRQWDVKGSDRPAALGSATVPGANWRGIVFAPDLKTVTAGTSSTILVDIGDPTKATVLGQPFDQHIGTSRVARFSPDGDVLATANPDGTIRLWDVTDRAGARLIGTPFGGGARVLGLDFSPDGRTLAAAGSDSLVRLWDIGDRTHPSSPGKPLIGQTGGVWDVAFSPDGRTLATAGGDRTIRLWDVADLTHPQPLGPPLTGHALGVLAVGFSPDGTVLASHGSDNAVHLWNVADRAHAVALGQPLTGQWGATFSPDGDTLVTIGSDNTINLWRLRQ